ncbi:MAG: peptidylprolyl isomerase [Candidatus Aminicenantes bacterium]|nr:peptidylprolyl isomerase [Candidatus Aminicenantes bacterium]
MKKTIWLLTAFICLSMIRLGADSEFFTSADEPDRIAVQHILIAFKGSIPKPSVTRSKDEAKKLAGEVLKRAQKGEDFPALVKDYTDDEYPGIYRLANKGVTPDESKQEYPRQAMIKSFGDVGFSLPVDGIGMAEYHSQNSKYGWHIIKRIE